MKISSDLLKRYETGPLILSNGRSLSHRMLVIQSVCQLEWELADLFVAFTRTLNSAVAEKEVRESLFGDGRPFDGLKRAADGAYAFGLISEVERSDLKRLGDMRNRYAHDRDREQLENDPKMMKIVRSCELWSANPELHTRAPQEAFRCMVAHLTESIRTKKDTLLSRSPPAAT